MRSGCAALIAAGLVVGAVYPNLKTAMWDMIGIYQQQGLVASFVANLQYTFYDEPDGYSEEAVREILDETPLAETISDVKALNVIFVMNEAFSDLRVINSDLVSDEYMPIWDRLTENTLKGFVHVPVFGNGTCDSEFEALTGVSTRYSGGYPFVLRVRYDTESIVRGFERNGFETVGYHPYFGDNWNRRWCYNSFGFDTFYSWDTDWEIEMLRGYASDAFNYKKVIRYNEESSSADHGFFMFNVTMQNHGGFTGDWDNFTKTVDLSEYGGYPEAETYFSLLQISDKEIGELISYYEQVDEPTLICIFGDHQPKIEDAYYEMLFGKKITELSQTEMMRRYVTPVMFWANYDIPEGDLGEFSVNYLSPLLMQYAGYELNPFQSLLLQMKEEYPVLSRNGIIASDGELISAEEEQESQLLKDYQMICYYLLQGGMVQ